MAYTAHADTFARDSLPPKSQWPDLMFELPELQYPRRLNCAAELLDKMVAGGHGERTVIRTLIDGKAYSCTYRQLLHRANRIARVLAEDLGLKPGQSRAAARAQQPDDGRLLVCGDEGGAHRRAHHAAAARDGAAANHRQSQSRRRAVRPEVKGGNGTGRGRVPGHEAGALLQRRRRGLARTKALGQAPGVRERRHRGRRRLPDRVHLRAPPASPKARCTFTATCWPCATASRAPA